MNKTIKAILFNRPAFYASLVVFTAVVVGLLFYSDCVR